MTKEVKIYFFEQYKKQEFRVVPGHWPDFKSKEEVDGWIRNMGELIDYYKSKKSHLISL